MSISQEARDLIELARDKSSNVPRELIEAELRRLAQNIIAPGVKDERDGC